jgi:hypothetical protein
MKVLECIARGNGSLFSGKLVERREEKVGGEEEGLSHLFTTPYLLGLTLGKFCLLSLTLG